MHWLSRLTLLLAAAGFLFFGAWFLVDPMAPLAAIDIEVSGEGAATEMRAFYGGLELALAAFLGLAAFRPGWSTPALWLVLLSNLGLGLGRVVGIAADGVFTGFFAGALAWEFGFAALAALALWVERGRR
ncbi:MAG: DUF4345 family protein [Lysobacteraceae bacterium]